MRFLLQRWSSVQQHAAIVNALVTAPVSISWAQSKDAEVLYLVLHAGVHIFCLRLACPTLRLLFCVHAGYAGNILVTHFSMRCTPVALQLFLLCVAAFSVELLRRRIHTPRRRLGIDVGASVIGGEFDCVVCVPLLGCGVHVVVWCSFYL